MKDTSAYPRYALYSGGKDSITMTHYMQDKIDGVLAIDTTIGTPHWKNFIEESIKEDFKNMALTDLLGLQNIFYYQYKGQKAERDYIYQLLAEEIEKRVR